MTELVADCPRCGAKKITFDLKEANYFKILHDWQKWYEVFCICRNCKQSTIFVISEDRYSDADFIRKTGLLNIKGSVNNYIRIEGFINLKDIAKIPPPEYLPENIKAAFEEGAACMSASCFNAAGTMFRLCIDLATRLMLPSENVNGLNADIKRKLGLRLLWLFDNNIIPKDLRELSSCIKDDGNDGAHEGSLSKEDAEDLLDFTYAILERIYSEPERLRLAKERRAVRRGKK